MAIFVMALALGVSATKKSIKIISKNSEKVKNARLLNEGLDLQKLVNEITFGRRCLLLLSTEALNALTIFESGITMNGGGHCSKRLAFVFGSVGRRIGNVNGNHFYSGQSLPSRGFILKKLVICLKNIKNNEVLLLPIISSRFQGVRTQEPKGPTRWPLGTTISRFANSTTICPEYY